MKKLLSAMLLLFILVGCTQPSKDDSKIKIGILQLLTHDALDASRNGFIDALFDNGFIDGDNITINYQNPEADQSNLATMADSLIAENPALILAIATPPTQQLQSINEKTPILATAVTDFVESGLVESNEKPGGLISGVSDGCPMDAQLNLLLEFDASVKTLGIIYTSSEANSKIQADQMVAECKKLNIETIIKTVADKTTIQEAMEAFVGKVDAVYVPTDNNIASAMASVAIVAEEHNIPVLCGESNMVSNGGLLSLGVDYYKIGYQTGMMAVSILKGEKTIDELPIGFQEDLTVYFNSKTALGIEKEIPQSILDRGSDVAK